MKKLALSIVSVLAITALLSSCESYTPMSAEDIQTEAETRFEEMKAEVEAEFTETCEADLETSVAAKLEELKGE